eukprot:201906_1
MSAQDKTVNNVVEDEEVPELEDATEEQQQIDPAQLEAMMQQLAGKQPKRYAKAMEKMGLDAFDAVINVKIKKSSGMAFSINKPEVYRF